MPPILRSCLAGLCAAMLAAQAQASTAARDLGLPFNGRPGPLDAITDVPGVLVGQATLISGAADKANGPVVRTGVTVVLPRGKDSDAAVTAGLFDLNGNGEVTGQAYLQDYGVIHGPIGITNTNAIGQVYAGIQQWTSRRFGSAIWPVVGETSDSTLNDIEGFHVTAETAQAALEAARGGPVEEGGVGGGTGMICFGFKGGIGTASRIVSVAGKTYALGVLVQCNTGARRVLRLGGAPVGRELADRWLPCTAITPPLDTELPPCGPDGTGGRWKRDQGSIIMVVATDAPLSSLQLDRLAKRAAMGLARLGSYSGNSSGDLMLAFSTAPGANDTEHGASPTTPQLPNGDIDPLFEAAVDASEEAISNALVSAQTMTGYHGHRAYALPHDTLKAIMAKYGAQ
ncbi:P1 family peptidase [Phenylobacterium montanum]|uniref:P1 family peptidase n=1 Tax=Phenylobacterium montanum TaxID=2823693 RepID=A0A975IVM0_9CAUL|nr:P1 family peptidase [Caulobacter sp. S6]QUD89147.1 P1 family peptidase [Caulobacter sp. S6]